MQLTQKQESIITRFLRDVAIHFESSLPKRTRERALRRLETKVDRALDALRDDALTDTHVEGVLRQLGSPEQLALDLTGGREPVTAQAKPERNRLWLGVCAELADRGGFPAWQVRLLAVLAGLVTGPLALVAYIGGFVAIYLSAAPAERPHINVLRLAGRAGGTFLIAIALNTGTSYALQFIYFAHEQYLKRPVPALGEWGWIEAESGSMLFWAVVLGVPLAVLSGLPLANAWDYSLKRLSQAILALYGVGLSFGIASVVVGILLDVAQDFSGFHYSDFFNMN